MDNKEEKVLSQDTKPLPDLSQIVTEEPETVAEPTMEELFDMETAPEVEDMTEILEETETEP